MKNMGAQMENVKEQPRFMLAAGASGSGKTLITCGILQALKNRGLAVSAFKCGPDYIDPMFHEKVLKTKSRNLDTFFTDEDTTRYLFLRNASGTDVSVMEGVMGYYDGLGGISEKASAYDLAKVTRTPVILVVDTKGMSLSILAYLKGFLTYRKDSGIQGVILNRMSAMLYPEVKCMIEAELGIKVYGYVPKVTDCVIESRHLGLVLPGEVEELGEKLQKLAGILEESLELDALLELAESAEKLETAGFKIHEAAASGQDREPVRIALARDEAFCFIYEDNLQLLRKLGAELVEFSPIHDRHLPEGISGLLLYGGYPELYARELSENTTMLKEIREAAETGLPLMAECGGFMYLHRSMEDMEGNAYPMAGVIEGKAYRTEKLGRFGYIELEELSGQEKEVMQGKLLRGHEFHYFDSTSCGEAYLARKPLRKRNWKCIHKTETMLAGFPHLYYYSNPHLAAEFLEKCRNYRKMGDK